LLKGVIGLFKANTVGDTIIFYNENEQELLCLPVLRQQQQKKDDCYYSLADFIAPKISGQIDYIGSFFVTAGLGAAPYIESLKQQGDDYGAIITRLLCDRLAEAFAEKLHKDVRQIYWGYEVPSDILENSTWFLKSNYEGIRPAFGYPSLNDQSQMKKIFSLLEIEKRTGATLTENNMIDPVSSICGLYFARKEARYFDITKIGTDQLLDYADRTGEELSNVERRLKQRGE
jgi:5-methyltetrahydrofolate--homocysteine methyltransferase